MPLIMDKKNQIITDVQKETLLNYLDSHVKESGFYQKIEQKIDTLNLNEDTNIEEIYTEIHNFMTNNMPQDVQDALFADIRRMKFDEV